jgi:phosphotransferase system  glucose/maltose/N-acetylglucosamine-specific IIC component
MLRLRIGILLIIISWLPIAQLILIIAHNHQQLTSTQASNDLRLIVWGIQIIIGFIGLWLAGKVAVTAAKQDGWKQTPKHLWQLLRRNSS